MTVVLSFFLTSLLSEGTYSIGPTKVRLMWAVSPQGTTRLIFPPLGEAIAKTHVAPVRFEVLLESVDLARLGALVDSPSQLQRLARGDIGSEARQVIIRFVARSLLISIMFGMIITFILTFIFKGGIKSGGLDTSPDFKTGRNPTAVFTLRRKALLEASQLGWSGAIPVIFIAMTILMTFNVRAFNRPTYKGALQSVPLIIDTVQEGIVKSAVLEERLITLTRNLYQMYERIEQLVPPLSIMESDVTILHITDIHLHPAALGVAAEMALAFDVDFIVNTGDLTEYGTVFEADFLKQLSDIPVPHFFVTGNHESPLIVERMTLMDHIILLDGREVDHAGIKILGVGDPGARSHLAHTIPPAESKVRGHELTMAIQSMRERPDIVAIHDFRTAEAIRPGLVPLVMYGHSHTPGVYFDSGTAYVNAGTTGGAGVRGVESVQAVTLSLAVIYLKKDEEGVFVIGVDIIRLSPVAGGFTLQRFLSHYVTDEHLVDTDRNGGS